MTSKEQKIKKEDILRIVKELATYNFDFSGYAEQSFSRRIEYLLSAYNLPDVDSLINKIRKDKETAQKIINDITVNTTELFRDPDMWLSLKRNVIPKLKKSDTVNIWHAGCSSGEEVYSMLILLNEEGLLEKTKVYATDINTEILEKAQNGVYNIKFNNSYFTNYEKVVNVNPLNFEEEINVPYTKYFDVDRSAGILSVKPFLKKNVTFRFHNLVNGGVFYKFDIIFCRNVIIYFNTELQNKVLTTFYESLFDTGMLILGSHESLSYLPVATKFEQKINRSFYFKRK